MSFKKMKRIILTGVSFFLISCSEQTESNSSNKSPNDTFKNTLKTLGGSENNISNGGDSIFSKNKIFISIMPSDKYLDSIQKTVPEDEWNEVVSDNEYYRDLTEEFLIKQGYKEVERPYNRFWYFKLRDKRIQRIDTLSLHKNWGNLIFNGKDSAFIFESASPEIELEDKL
jgi:hypothetical protein